MNAQSPAYIEKLRQAEAAQEAFRAAFGVRRIKWSSHHLARILNLTGEPEERVAEARRLIGLLGMGNHGSGYYRWISQNGVFDHGEMWGRGRVPLLIVGHPYRITDEERDLLAELREFPGLSVGVDDRPSYYGFRTHHVRIGLAEGLWPA